MMGDNPDPEIARRYAATENQYWEAVWWHNRGVLEKDRTRQAVAFGTSATGFSNVIASLEDIQSRSGMRQKRNFLGYTTISTTSS